MIGSMFDGAARLARTAGATASDAARRAADAGIAARDTVVEAGSSVRDMGVAARDGVTDTAEAVGGYGKAAVDVAAITAAGLTWHGLIVGAIVAPIPTLVGALIIKMMISLVEARIEGASDELAVRKRARDNARILERLARYGRIPATAIVETPSAVLRLDTVANAISGEVKTGRFSSRDIAGMSVMELREFSGSTDPETSELIESYLSFRERSAEALPGA